MANQFNEGEILYYFTGLEFVKVRVMAAINYVENYFSTDESLLYKILLPSGEERFQIPSSDLSYTLDESFINECKKSQLRHEVLEESMNMMSVFIKKAYKEAERKERDNV